MLPLAARKIRILKAIVNDYVSTTRPVGSERLLELYALGCKSATVRNEMAELSDLGYIVQPHTSSGRIPTDQGYRYYVDELMNPPAALAPEEAQTAQQNSLRARNEIEEVLLQTCRVLSGLTSYPSVATDPITETTRLGRVYLTEASPRHALLVVLLSTGHVEHRLVELETVPEENTLVRLTNFINGQIGERDLTDIMRLLAGMETPHELHPHTHTLARVAAALTQVVNALSERRVFLEGMNQILRQPEFKDVERLTALLNALEQPGMLYRMLADAPRDCEITIIIGTENVHASLQECSVITTSYRIGDRPAGRLGVVGPTRMDYDRAAAAVGLMAQNLSLMLTSLSLA